MRSQLNEMRKQLVRRDIDDGTTGHGQGAALSSSMAGKERQTRQVYEGIIEDLRREGERGSSRIIELNRRLEEMTRKSSRMEQLEQEVSMYKEMAKSMAEERNSYNASASEANERSAKASHDYRTSLQELHASQAELKNARDEAASLREELEAGRAASKVLHSKKLAADKAVAEAMTANSRLETTIEELRQKLNVASIDLDKAQRTISNQTLSLGDSRVDVQQMQSLKSEVRGLQHELSAAKAIGRQRELDAARELTVMREANLSHEREIEALRKKQDAHRRGFDDAVVELEKARIEMEAVVSHRDRLQRELAQLQSKKTENHIQELRKDLEGAMKDWKGVESEKTLRDEQLMLLEKELLKERDKYKLSQREIAVLEDKLRLAQQEVGVYRSIDVYQSAMQAELSSFRQTEQSMHSKARLTVVPSSSSAPPSSSTAFDSDQYDSDRLFKDDDDVRYADSRSDRTSSRLRTAASVAALVAAPPTGPGSRLSMADFDSQTPLARKGAAWLGQGESKSEHWSEESEGDEEARRRRQQRNDRDRDRDREDRPRERRSDFGEDSYRSSVPRSAQSLYSRARHENPYRYGTAVSETLSSGAGSKYWTSPPSKLMKRPSSVDYDRARRLLSR